MIQNAEDANATRVKFLHDKHSHDTEHLYDEDLAQFQVNALFCLIFDRNEQSLCLINVADMPRFDDVEKRH